MNTEKIHSTRSNSNCYNFTIITTNVSPSQQNVFFYVATITDYQRLLNCHWLTGHSNCHTKQYIKL